MGKLVAGKWTDEAAVSTGGSGEFVRARSVFRDWLRAKGPSGFVAEPGRYHLYVAHACPWAHRVLIVRRLKGLEEAIDVSFVDPVMGPDGWTFGRHPRCTPDRIGGEPLLRNVYLKANPEYSGRVTVPLLWDRKSSTIVNNESRELIRMLDTECNDFADSTVDLAPAKHRKHIDEVIDAIYEPINNGVYRCGFARTQAAYERAVGELFAALDHWDHVLSGQRYLCGATLTEADVCLFATLWRFDLVYHGHFKCNVRTLREYPNLWGFVRDVYQTPGVAETCDVELTKLHYYGSHRSLNPTGIVPLGPEIDFNAGHDRARFD